MEHFLEQQYHKVLELAHTVARKTLSPKLYSHRKPPQILLYISRELLSYLQLTFNLLEDIWTFYQYVISQSFYDG